MKSNITKMHGQQHTHKKRRKTVSSVRTPNWKLYYSSVSTVTITCWRPRTLICISVKYKRFFFSPNRPDRLRCPPWTTEDVSQGVNWTSRATYNCRLLQESTMHEATSLLPHKSSRIDVQKALGPQHWNMSFYMNWAMKFEDSISMMCKFEWLCTRYTSFTLQNSTA